MTANCALPGMMLLFGQALAETARAVQSWIEGLGPTGIVIYGLLYIAAVVLLASASVLTLMGGAIFGLLPGTIVVSLASTTGAALAFLISRYLARERIARKIARNPKFAAIDQAISQEGWKIVALLRLSPAVPFNLQNYLYGLTGIGFWACVLTSWVAMLPGTLLYVYLGYLGRASLETAAGQAGEPMSAARWSMVIVGLVATIAVTVYVTRLARAAIMQRTQIVDVEETAGAKPVDLPAQNGWPWGASITALIALASLGIAIFAQFNPERSQEFFRSLLGSPANGAEPEKHGDVR